MKKEEVKKPFYQGMHQFACSCGGAMATNAELLMNAISSGKSYECPNVFYKMCNKTYSAEEFKKRSTYIQTPIWNK